MTPPLLRALAAALLTALPPLASPTSAQAQPSRPVEAAASLDAARITALRLSRQATDLPPLRTPVGTLPALRLEPIEIWAPGARIVVVGPAGEREIAVDPSRVALYRGHAPEVPGSSVFLAVSAEGVDGLIEMGGLGGMRSLRLDASGAARAVGPHPGAPAPGTPRCDARPTGSPGAGAGGDLGAGGGPAGVTVPGRLIVELAVETDYEFFELFGDAQAAADYVASMYAAGSAVLERDTGVALELTFVRLWETPDDLFNEESPLGAFRNYWNRNMRDVPRDLAQFISGRRNFPYGGSAYLTSLCTDAGYSVCGYMLGRFPDTSISHPEAYDVMVTVHELGHNLGARHTHDYNLDTCDDFDTVPQRGTIMSYCSQTVSGGNAVTDVRIHRDVRPIIRQTVLGASCRVRDCNGNGRDDERDIDRGRSQDADGDGIPDECQDCNGNGVLDSIDIQQGDSPDADGDGVPDECQPDCNGTGLPDALDIAQGTSEDRNVDGIPDECQADEDGNGAADEGEIRADMTLDLDRDRRLDRAQDCDGDGIIDSAALDGAWDVWVATTAEAGDVKRMNGRAGTTVLSAGAQQATGGSDVVITPDRRILVSSARRDAIVMFDDAGTHLGDLVSPGGVLTPRGMVLTPDGRLLVASEAENSVLAFEADSGAPLGTLVAPGDGGLNVPFGLLLEGDELLVTSRDGGEVIAYDARNGSYIRTVVSAGNNGGLASPRGLALLPDGTLLVCSHDTNSVLAFRLATGEPLGKWNRNGTADRLTLDGPWGIRVGPDGMVYVSRHHAHGGGGFVPDDIEQRLHLNSTRLYRFDAASGNFLTSFIMGNDTGLMEPTGFAFMPGAATDCNVNFVPDSCDIARGFSRDDNADGIPDECGCPADLDGSGGADGGDFLLYLAFFFAGDARADFTGDGAVDGSDFLAFLAAFFRGC